MASQENPNMVQLGNGPYSEQHYTAEKMQNYPQAEDTITYRAVDPEIYYKLKPYITMAGDLISSYGMTLPTQQQMDDIVDGIHKDFCEMNPDMKNYLSKYEEENDPSDDPPPFQGGFRDGVRGGEEFRGGFRPRFGFRRRGLGRDFISALLLSELLGRDGYY